MGIISGDSVQLNGIMHTDTAAATMTNEAFTVQLIHHSTVNCWHSWLPKAKSCPINVSTQFICMLIALPNICIFIYSHTNWFISMKMHEWFKLAFKAYNAITSDSILFYLYFFPWNIYHEMCHALFIIVSIVRQMNPLKRDLFKIKHETEYKWFHHIKVIQIVWKLFRRYF